MTAMCIGRMIGGGEQLSLYSVDLNYSKRKLEITITRRPLKPKLDLVLPRKFE